MTINEYEAFLKWHFENWKFNCAHSDTVEEARKIYDRIYQNNKPNHIAERERGFMAWKAGKAQAVPEGYVLFPKVATKEIDEILGMQCFQFIRTAQIYRELGFEIKKKAEDEQSFFLFNFLHLALVHGDKYLDVFNAETRKLIKASKSGVE